MYITKATINGIEETITYPIVVSVAQDIRALLGLNDSVPLRIGEDHPLLLNKDTNGKVTHTPDIQNEELVIEYTETTVDDLDIALNSWSPTVKNIYTDNAIHSYIRPILTSRKLTFNITYYGKSKSRVTTIMNRLASRNQSDTRNRLHNLGYFYYLPEIVKELVSVLNDLKNTYVTPIVDFDTYIGDTFATQANIINSETGNPIKIELGMRENQQSVIGTIDTDVYQLTKDKDDESNRWNFDIEYSIEYAIPTQLLVAYPITVYNQAIPPKFRIANTRTPVSYGNRTSDSEAIDVLTARRPLVLDIPSNGYYYRIPPEDNLTLPTPEVGYVRLFSVVATIDLVTPTHLFYLDELPGVAFKNDILELIKLEAGRMGDAYTSIFYIEIFDHEARLYTHKVVVSVVNELVNGIAVDRILLTTDLPLDIKGCYRITFNILSDLTLFVRGALALLETSIKTVDAATVTPFSVIDTVLGVLDLDITKLRHNFQITDNTTSIQVALNISNNLWYNVYTRQTSLVLTEMLVTK